MSVSELHAPATIGSTQFPKTIAFCNVPSGFFGKLTSERFVGTISCGLMTTFPAIAKNPNLKFREFTCEAEGKLEMAEQRKGDESAEQS